MPRIWTGVASLTRVQPATTQRQAMARYPDIRRSAVEGYLNDRYGVALSVIAHPVHAGGRVASRGCFLPTAEGQDGTATILAQATR